MPEELQKRKSERKPSLLKEDQQKVITFIKTILKESSKGSKARQMAEIELLSFIEAVDSGNMVEIRGGIDDNDELIKRLRKNSSQENGSSKTGNLSGKGRDNAR